MSEVFAAMTIPIKKEPDELAGNFFGAVEKCSFCSNETKFWHENTNNPVCPDCSKEHKVSELVDYGKRIRAAKRKAAR